MDLPLPQNKKILLSPLYWGMGHTTRLVPIISACLSAPNEVWLAVNQLQKSFYQDIFGDSVQYLGLHSPEIQYGSSRRDTQWQLIRQVPKWQRSLRHDHAKLAEWQSIHTFDWVISDARMGLYHPEVHSVLINHQVHPISNLGRLGDHLLQLNAEKQMQKFDEIWVPDEAEYRLAGTLSQLPMQSRRFQYIGWLTHLTRYDYRPEVDFLFILSGPEPQRTIFEEMAIDFFEQKKNKGYYVGGQVSEDGRGLGTLSSDELSRLLSKTRHVVTRSGYSTLMDLRLYPEIEVFLTPTPGQPEQEYLYRHLTSGGDYRSLKSLQHS